MKQSALVSLILSDVGKRQDLTADASAAVSNAVLHYQRERFWFLETVTAITTSASLATYPTPANLGGNLDSVMVTVSGRRQPMTRTDFSDIDEKDDGVFTGQPSEYCVYGDKIRLWPVPDKTYTFRVSYQMTLDAPSVTGSNVWTNAASDLIRHRAAWDMWMNTLRNVNQAMVVREAEKDAYFSLMSETTRRISTGKIKKTGW